MALGFLKLCFGRHHPDGDAVDSERGTSPRDEAGRAPMIAPAQRLASILHAASLREVASHPRASHPRAATLQALSAPSLDAACGALVEPLACVVFEREVRGAGAGVAELRVRCVWCNAARRDMAAAAGGPEAALLQVSAATNRDVALRQVLLGLLKSVQNGQQGPVETWSSTANGPPAAIWLQPCIWAAHLSAEDTLACLVYSEPQQEQLRRPVAMCPKHTPYCVTTTCQEGYICSQNAAAMAQFGCQPPCCRKSANKRQTRVNFLAEVFHGHEELFKVMQNKVSSEGYFQSHIQLLSPLLRQWLEADEGQAVWHQVHVSAMADSDGAGAAYVVAQLDVSELVLAKQQVTQLQEQQQALLKEILPPQVIDVILQSKSKAGPCGAGPQLGQAPPSLCCRQGPHDLLVLCEDGGAGAHEAGTSTSDLTSQSSSLAGAAAAASLQDASGRIWLTQQDVKSLATCHDEVTILFADIKGFTSLSQDLDPSEVMLFLNQLYSMWDEMLDTHGIYKVETIGDSYMVAGGLFSLDSSTGTCRLGGHDPLHARKVLDFAKAMLESASLLLDPKGQPVQIRIGIHTGSCVSGVVGQRMPRFCLFGDTINTASRMESNCPRPGCIHASAATYAMLREEPWQATGGFMCKGKGLMLSYVLPVTSDDTEEDDGVGPLFEMNVSGSCSMVTTPRICDVLFSRPCTEEEPAEQAGNPHSGLYLSPLLHDCLDQAYVYGRSSSTFSQPVAPRGGMLSHMPHSISEAGPEPAGGAGLSQRMALRPALSPPEQGQGGIWSSVGRKCISSGFASGSLPNMRLGNFSASSEVAVRAQRVLQQLHQSSSESSEPGLGLGLAGSPVSPPGGSAPFFRLSVDHGRDGGRIQRQLVPASSPAGR